MHTQSDAIAHITEAIEATGVIPDAAADYDLDAIANELHTAAGGWDLTDLDTWVLWAAIQRHALHDGQDKAPVEVSADTDIILNDLAYAAEQITQAREDIRAAEAARDALLTRAAHTGAATQSELAQLAGVTRARVNQIINRQ